MSGRPPVGPDPRITRRRRAIARTRRRRLMVRAGVAAIIVLLAWLALWSPLLKVRRVVVAGGRHVSRADVVAATGLDSGDGILMLSSDDVVDAVEALPWVRSADVARRLPSTVSVRILERRPAMVLRTSTGDWTLDGRGTVLQRGAASARLPLLAAVSLEVLSPGERVRSSAVRSALSGFAAMPRDLARRVRAAFAPSPDRISYSLAGDILVRYGSAERRGDKNEVLAALLERLGRRSAGVGYIDVRVPSSPAIAESPPATGAS